MKKSLKLIGIFLVVLLSAGCMDFKAKMEINNDKSVNLAMSMEINLLEFINKASSDETFSGGLKTYLCSSMCPGEENSEEYLTCVTSCNESTTNETEIPSESEIKAYLDEYMNSEEFNTDSILSAEDKQKIESKGYKVETNVDKKNYVISVNITGHFANIDDISSDSDVSMNIGEIFTGEGENKFFTKSANNTYKANFRWDDESTEDFSMEGIDIEQFLTYTYEVTLPNKSITNNANKVSDDNKTLTWNLTSNSSNNISYEFAFPTKKASTTTSDTFDQNILAYGLIAGGGLLLVIALIAYVISNKKKA